MSLLLEALKKAELAKQSASADSLKIEPVMTRDGLPDISQPLEIQPNDLPSARRAAVSNGLASSGNIASASSLAPSVQAPDGGGGGFSAAGHGYEAGFNATSASGSQDAERIAARRMFETAEMDHHPKRPFYVTLGLLGICALGYGSYVWWQMQPRSPYNSAAARNTKNAGPAPASPPPLAAPVTAGPATLASAPAAVAAPAPATLRPPAPDTPPANATTPRSTAPSTPPERPRTAQSKPAAALSASGPPQGLAAPITIKPTVLAVDPEIAGAYEAFQRGELATARDQYQRALQREPANRDALLGLAAIDVRTRNYELAESRYLRLLEADPRDVHAMAGIISLRGSSDPVQSQSRLKTLIAGQPDSPHLHFALGNQYAAQSRWHEAQTAYFKAFSLDPENPDFAFNLAVSLDRIHQGKIALDYYRRALALAGSRAAGFDAAQAGARIAELSR